MKIALIGYGKMGRAIEQIAIGRGHEIACRIDVGNLDDFDTEAFATADVAIEFTTPATAVANYRRAFAKGLPVVSGTTGWTAQLKEVRQLCDDGEGTLLWSSNFSLGVNLFMAVNSYLAALMQGQPQYAPSMMEVHHVHKLDHPSGTAIALAEGVMHAAPRIARWTEDHSAAVPADVMLIDHRREGEVPGTHIVRWESAADTITIEHRAHSREGFALGAVVAAEWAASRSGWLTMDQLMRSLVGNPALLDIVK